MSYFNLITINNTLPSQKLLKGNKVLLEPIILTGTVLILGQTVENRKRQTADTDTVTTVTLLQKCCNKCLTLECVTNFPLTPLRRNRCIAKFSYTLQVLQIIIETRSSANSATVNVPHLLAKLVNSRRCGGAQPSQCPRKVPIIQAGSVRTLKIMCNVTPNKSDATLF